MDTNHDNVNRYEDDSDDELNEHWHEPGDPDGVVAEEQQRKQEEADAVNSAPAVEMHLERRKPKRLWKFVLGVVLLAAAAGAAYWIGSSQASTPSKKPAAQTARQTKPAQNITVPTAHYDSATYAIGVDYPNNWVESDTTQKLTITSPSMQMSTLSGQVNGHVIVTVQNQQTTLAGFPANGALASLASDKLTYKQPTGVQRAQTYLSYLGFSSANDINALYLTGDAGYQQGQSIPLADVVKGNPLVSATFASCSDSACAKSTQTPLVLRADSWKNAQFKPAVLSILESLAIN